jgi:hypothetical protein
MGVENAHARSIQSLAIQSADDPLLPCACTLLMRHDLQAESAKINDWEIVALVWRHIEALLASGPQAAETVK